MPTIRQSRTIDTRRLEPTNDERPAITQPVMSIVPLDTTQMSPLMVASLPSIASGADVYIRQFYRGGPGQRRFLPVTL